MRGPCRAFKLFLSSLLRPEIPADVFLQKRHISQCYLRKAPASLSVFCLIPFAIHYDVQANSKQTASSSFRPRYVNCELIDSELPLITARHLRTSPAVAVELVCSSFWQVSWCFKNRCGDIIVSESVVILLQIFLLFLSVDDIRKSRGSGFAHSYL
jgi:hypothetical protein